MSTPDIIALIPARSGSKGVPDKNILPLCGRPVLAWTIAACLKAEIFRRVIVSTDSPEYASLAIHCGAEAPFLRPPEFATDSSTDYDFVAHALEWLASNDREPQFFAHMRPTTPLRDPDLLVAAVGLFSEMPQATALRSVHPMAESAYKTFEIVDEGTLKPVGVNSTALDAANDARQSFPTTYQANGYIDILSVAHIQRQGQLHGDRVAAFMTPVVTEIDTHDDLAYLEFECLRNPELVSRIFA